MGNQSEREGKEEQSKEVESIYILTARNDVLNVSLVLIIVFAVLELGSDIPDIAYACKVAAIG